MKILRDVFKYIIFLGIGVLLLYLALRNLSWQKIIEGFKNANYLFVFIALLIGLLSHYIRAVRWNLLIEPLDHKVSAKNSFIAVLVGYMVNFAVPRMGEISRCVILNRSDKIQLNKLIGTVLIERIFDTIVLLLILILTLIIQFKRLKELIYHSLLIPLKSKIGSMSVFSWLILVVIIIVFIILVIFIIRFIRHKAKTNKFFRKINDFLSGLYSGVKTIVTLKKKWRFIFLTVGIWICYLMMAFTLFSSTDSTHKLGIVAALSVLSIGSIGMVIPSPGGMGSWHYAVILALTFYKPLNVAPIDWKNGTALYTLISHESQMIFLILAGAVAYLIFIINQRKNKSDEAL